MRLGLTLVLLLVTSANHAVAQGDIWTGDSGLGGGRVEFGYPLNPDDEGFDPERAESMPLSVTCNGFNGSAWVDIPIDLTSFDIGSIVRFEIDGTAFEYGAGVSWVGGDYTALPSVELQKGDPLFEALMAGESAEVYFGRESVVLSLDGTRDLFTRHLQNCL